MTTAQVAPTQQDVYVSLPKALRRLIEEDQLVAAVGRLRDFALTPEQLKWVGEQTAHVLEADAYRRLYAGKMQGTPVPEGQIFFSHTAVRRFQGIREQIISRKQRRVLDLGCLDGWCLLNLAAAGCTGVGVDLNAEALAIARDRARKYGFKLDFVESAIEDLDLWTEVENDVEDGGLVRERILLQFDAVLISEVLEHVRDPLACLKAAARHLAPGGVVYISVPATPIPHHGKLEDALLHFRVFGEGELKELCRQAGLPVVVDHEVTEQEDRGIGFGHRMLAVRQMRATIYCNHVTGGWDPRAVDRVNASEEATVRLAEAWAAAGADVVFHLTLPASQAPLVHNGVRYTDRAESPEGGRDVLVLFKTLDHLDTPARVKLFWTMDLPQPNLSATWLPPHTVQELTAVVCISEYHRREVLKACPWVPPEKVVTHWIGIDKEEIRVACATQPKIPKRVVYASSPDRGLLDLLRVWPDVKRDHPDAELHVLYGFEFWRRSEAVVPEQVRLQMRAAREAMEKLLKTLPGVSASGRLPRQEYLRELAEAEVWAYPCNGGELCCKTALEAQAARCLPVVVPTMALEETVQCGHKVPPEGFSAALREALGQSTNGANWNTVRTPSWADMAAFFNGLLVFALPEPERKAAPVFPAAEEAKLPDRFTIPSRRRMDRYDLDIVLVAPGMRFHGNTDREASLGGSETMAIQMARAMRRRGHHISVFSDTDRPGTYDQVVYRPLAEASQYIASTPHDVCIIQRDPGRTPQPIWSRLTLLWCHDLALTRYLGTFRSALWNVDYIVPVSHWHGRQLCEVYSLDPAGIVPMRNAIEINTIQGKAAKTPIKRDANALVYTSRPERGLDLLLDHVFPRLLERDPGLKLYVSGYDNVTDHMRAFYDHCQGRIRTFGARAQWMGFLKKADLYALYRRARCMLYPTRSFEEVSCITLMEAAACGLPVVATTLGALPETASLAPGAARLVEHDGSVNETYIRRFVDAAWDVIRDDTPTNAAMSAAGPAGATAYSWESAAAEWEDFLLGAIEMRSTDRRRLARHFWRLGDSYGTAAALEEAGGGITAGCGYVTREAIATLPQDAPPEPFPSLITSIGHGIFGVPIAPGGPPFQPKTVLGLGPYGDAAATALAALCGARPIPQAAGGKADLVVGIETLDCSTDPRQHIVDAEAQATAGGRVCLVTASPGVQLDRLNLGAARAARWVFDTHDMRDLLGLKREMLALTLGGGMQSSYDSTLLAWRLYLWPAGQGGPRGLDWKRRLDLQAPSLSLSACLMVYDGEAALHRCIKSFRRYADEIVVNIDPKTTDSSPQIAAQYGALVAPGKDPLIEGFDEARNANIARATGDIILWIDADEELLDPIHLPKYLRWNQFAGYGVRQHHFSAVPENAFRPDLPVRLFRRVRLDGEPTGIRFFGCVHGDTPIATPAGPRLIRELAGTQPWVYCYSHRKRRMTLARADWVGVTRRNAQLLEVELDDGTVLRVTEEHPFLRRKAWAGVKPGNYIPARSLKPGDRLMPFYRMRDGRQKDPRRGWDICLRGTQLRRAESRFVYEEIYGRIPPGYAVHHKDRNPANNVPENLRALPIGAHASLHRTGAKRSAKTRACIIASHAPCAGPLNAMWGRRHSEETRKDIGRKSRERGAGFGSSAAGWFTPERARSMNARTWADPTIRQKRINGIRRAKAAAMIGNHRVVAVRPGGVADVYNIEMPEPDHNFVAGSVVVHNCVHEHPETKVNNSVGQSVVLSDVHIAHSGYYTEETRRKRFDRNISLMFRDRAKWPERLLGRYLMVRDWVHLARYEMQAHGGQLTPQAAEFLEVALRDFRQYFLGETNMMGSEGMQYYHQALELLGRGFDAEVKIAARTLDGSMAQAEYRGRFHDRADLEQYASKVSKNLSGQWEGKYL